MKKIGTIILGAGLGTRMKSNLPKVMHPVLANPMITYPVKLALEINSQSVVVVVGYKRELVENYLKQKFNNNIKFAYQPQQLGTADAVKVAKDEIGNDVDYVLILYGDVPLLQKNTIEKLIDNHFSISDRLLSLVVTKSDDPPHYGRFIRDKNDNIIAIKEYKDCNETEKLIKEINPGIYLIKREFLFHHLDNISSLNAQKEFYLTDLIEIAAKESNIGWVYEDFTTLQGVNDRVDLAKVNNWMNTKIIENWQKQGVTIFNPQNTFITTDVIIGKDTIIEQGVIITGKTTIGEGSYIEAGVRIEDCDIENDVTIKAYSVLEKSIVGKNSIIGPMAHLRPDSNVKQGAHIGNFVELKKTTLGENSKANHLSYLGDGIIGKNVNIGAGTIFCNYDGFGKYITNIEDEVFIGSDSQLVAPVTIGKGSYVGTGSTVTKDVPQDSLSICRANQVNKENYAPKLKEKLKERKANSKKK